LDLADIVQEGCTGLITAAKRFDPDLGFRFTTYAYHWVHQAQFRALYFQCNMMRWPVFRAPALIAAALQGHEKGLKAGEMAPVSLHWGVSRRLCNLSFFQLDPITSLVRQQAQSALFEVLAQLKPQEREVIERRFGIGGGEEETLDSIGQDFCLTRERVRQIEAKALRRLEAFSRYQLLSPHRDALNWRETCAVDDASARLQAPFRDYMQGICNPTSEG
jgi:RNA polymerase primary sigma factor